MRAALTIAGSDSGSGAGLQADLKTFAAFGLHGLTAVTAVTAQNSAGIRDTHVLPPDVVEAQIAAVAADFPVAALKTGMLARGAVVDAVCRQLEALALRPVVDPVLIATSGSRLLDEEGVRRMRERLLPLAAVVTPNRMEAERLSGVRITSPVTAREAARRILDLGPRAVIVTGGHVNEQADTVVDLLDDGAGGVEIATPRAGGPGGSRIHGTGCAFSAALTAGLAAGRTLPAAAEDAQRYVAAAIRRAHRIGRGGLVLDHAPPGAPKAGERDGEPGGDRSMRSGGAGSHASGGEPDGEPGGGRSMRSGGAGSHATGGERDGEPGGGRSAASRPESAG